MLTRIPPETCCDKGYGLVSECRDIPCLPADWDVGSKEACVILDVIGKVLNLDLGLIHTKS